LLRKTNRAGCADALQSRGNVDAIAHEVSVRLLNHITEMDADAELDTSLSRHVGVVLDHAALHFDGAADGADHVAKFGEEPIPGALDHAPFVNGDGRVDQIATQARNRASVPSSSAPASRL
jgi:hypothetical protein